MTRSRAIGSNFSVVRPTSCRTVCVQKLGWWSSGYKCKLLCEAHWAYIRYRSKPTSHSLDKVLLDLQLLVTFNSILSNDTLVKFCLHQVLNCLLEACIPLNSRRVLNRYTRNNIFKWCSSTESSKDGVLNCLLVMLTCLDSTWMATTHHTELDAYN